VLITGENGNGKSTIFEALVWCLFGETVRGYKADQVVNRDVGEGCAVTVKMSTGVISYRVTRCRKHKTGKNKLELFSYDHLTPGAVEVDLTQQTNDDTQHKLQEIMGIDFDTFINGPMMPQGSFKRFSEMTDSEIKDILEKAVQIEVIAKAQNITKQNLAIVELKLRQFDYDFNRYGQEFDEKQSQLEDFEREHLDWDNQKKAEIDRTTSRVQEFEDRLTRLRVGCADPKELFNQLVEAKQAHSKISEIYEDSRKDWEKKEDEARSDEAHAVTQHMLLSKECERLKDTRDKIKSLTGTCPKCGQDIPASHVEKLFAEADNQFQEANTELKTKLVPAVKVAQDVVQQVKLDRDKALERAKEIWLVSLGKLHELEKELEINTNQISVIQQCQSDIKRAQESLDIAVKVTSPFESMIKNNKEAQEEIKKDIKRILPKLKSCGIEAEHFRFWVDGFSNRGLKSFVLGSVVPYMNSKAAEYSQVLTDGELEIRFHTQTTLKSGETREKFYVEVSNKAGAEDYIGSSGGERRRADLAISFTLSDLFSSRSKKAFPQRWFDEPFENLDEAGVEAVMQLLRSMEAQSGSIFVVTHQDHLKSMFNKVIQVEKINGETRIS
jgi:DNA repair exonuclease SbcCD ATPase subunit